jgi:hypothetical protein
MVVDGRTELVGSSSGDALRAIGAASQSPKPAVRLSWQQGEVLSIRVDALASAPSAGAAQVFLVVAENMLRTDVRHGENAGRTLEHNGVVRQLLPLEKIAAAREGFSSTITVHAAREWNRANLRAVVFVQERHSRRVLAVAAIPFPS